MECSTCHASLEPLKAAVDGTVGVCPYCGELLRKEADVVRLYTEVEARDAHHEVLERLREIQHEVRRRLADENRWLEEKLERLKKGAAHALKALELTQEERYRGASLSAARRTSRRLLIEDAMLALVLALKNPTPDAEEEKAS